MYPLYEAEKHTPIALPLPFPCVNAIADYLFSPPPSVNNKREKTGRYEQKIVLIVEGPPSSYISKKEGGNYFYFFKISTFLSGSLFRAEP